jgi:hypothetical protein
MKTIALQLLILCGSLVVTLPAQAEAAPVKTFGGFAPGRKITLTVQQMSSTVASGTQLDTSKVPVPEGIPKYKLGQKVTFTIGTKGELICPNVSGNKTLISFLGSVSNANSYAKQATQKTPSPSIASIFKDSAGKPVGASLTFYLYRINGYKLVISRVNYLLN